MGRHAWGGSVGGQLAGDSGAFNRQRQRGNGRHLIVPNLGRFTLAQPGIRTFQANERQYVESSYVSRGVGWVNGVGQGGLGQRLLSARWALCGRSEERR